MRYLIPLLTILASAACGADAVDLEAVPVGAEVAVAKEDGGLVTGTVKERSPEAVKLDVGQAERTVERKEIAALRVVDPAAPEPAPVPVEARFREYTLPAGTDLIVTLATSVDSKTSRLNEAVTARLAETVSVGGNAVVPEGSQLTGTITEVTPSGKVKGRATMALAFRSLGVDGHEAPYAIDARTSFVADATKKDDAAKIGVPAAGGAIIGGILGGKKGAVIGGVVGAGAGTAVVLTTAGEEVSLPAGTKLRIALTDAIHVRVPIVR